MEDIKMINILDELYDYDLFHMTEIEDMDGSYKSALDRLVKAEAELKKAYPDSTEILDEYQCCRRTLSCIISPTAMSSARASRSAHSSSLK